MVAQVLKKLLALKMGHLGPKRGKDEVLGNLLGQHALVFAGFDDNEVLYLVADGSLRSFCQFSRQLLILFVSICT